MKLKVKEAGTHNSFSLQLWQHIRMSLTRDIKSLICQSKKNSPLHLEHFLALDDNIILTSDLSVLYLCV